MTFKRIALPERKPIVYRPISGGVAARITDEVMAQPKTKPHRWPALLTMANGRHCLLTIPGECVGGTGSVACHSNQGVHEKGGHRKADGEYSVWGCWACHEWLDRGKATAEEKSEAFAVAHIRQVAHWRVIAADPKESERNRRAAGWALEMLEAKSKETQS